MMTSFLQRCQSCRLAYLSPGTGGRGRGLEGGSGGAGHGGRGGRFVDKEHFIYGNRYGLDPVEFIGGSVGELSFLW